MQPDGEGLTLVGRWLRRAYVRLCSRGHHKDDMPDATDGGHLGLPLPVGPEPLKQSLVLVERFDLVFFRIVYYFSSFFLSSPCLPA